MKLYRFFQGNNAPAYSCDHPNDNSGYYYPKDEVDKKIKELMQAIDFKIDQLDIDLDNATNHVTINYIDGKISGLKNAQALIIQHLLSDKKD